jgi:hypothetical protein
MEAKHFTLFIFVGLWQHLPNLRILDLSYSKFEKDTRFWRDPQSWTDNFWRMCETGSDRSIYWGIKKAFFLEFERLHHILNKQRRPSWKGQCFDSIPCIPTHTNILLALCCLPCLTFLVCVNLILVFVVYIKSLMQLDITLARKIRFRGKQFCYTT